MKSKINKIRVIIGIICIFISLVTGYIGYQGNWKLLEEYGESTVMISNLHNKTGYTEFEQKITEDNFLYFLGIPGTIIFSNMYNFLLGEFIVFLFGLNFLLHGLEEK